MKASRIKIGSRLVGEGHPVFIIAEAGINHNGDLGIAKNLAEAAKSCGADCIKFQTFTVGDLVVPCAPSAEYQKTSKAAKSQLAMLKGLELSRDEFSQLAEYCKKKKIMFLSSPFDSGSAHFLNNLGVPAFKIGSGELTNTPFLSEVASFKRPVILSTGMAFIWEVKEAVKAIFSAGNKDVILLHCVSSYPAEYDQVNLKAINTLADEFGLLAGYSDHTMGIEISVAAVSMGACVIEKHFTLDRGLAGPDHKVSLEPHEFKNMVTAIRNTQKAIGNGIKRPQKAELEIMRVARKSIVAACNIPKGAILKHDMFAAKRPGTGIKPALLGKLINKKAVLPIKRNQLMKWEYVK